VDGPLWRAVTVDEDDPVHLSRYQDAFGLAVDQACQSIHQFDDRR